MTSGRLVVAALRIKGRLQRSPDPIFRKGTFTDTKKSNEGWGKKFESAENNLNRLTDEENNLNQLAGENNLNQLAEENNLNQVTDEENNMN